MQRSGTDSRAAVLFLGGMAISTVGSALGALESTYIATDSDPAAGATRTAVMIVILLLASTATVPFVSGLALRWGSRRLYSVAVFGTGIIWSAAGLAILSGLPAYPILLLSAPFMGVTVGMTTVLSPIFGRAYLSSQSMAGAYARLSVILGLSWGAGSLIGGQLFQHTPPGVGILTRGVLAIPLAVVLVAVRPPTAAPEPVAQRGGSLRAMTGHLRTPSPLRTVLALSCAVTIFVIPFLSLIVPIASALRQVPLVSGAGLLMAGMAVGEVFSPLLVSRLQRHRSSPSGAVWAALSCGGCLLAFAVTSYLTSGQPELLVWTTIGIAYGASRYAVKSLELDAAVNCDVDDTEAVATVSFAKTAVAPLGLLVWATLIDHVSVETALLVGCVGITVSALAVKNSVARLSERGRSEIS